MKHSDRPDTLLKERDRSCDPSVKDAPYSRTLYLNTVKVECTKAGPRRRVLDMVRYIDIGGYCEAPYASHMLCSTQIEHKDCACLVTAFIAVESGIAAIISGRR